MLFGPDNATCGGTAVFTSTATVAGNGALHFGCIQPGCAEHLPLDGSYSGDMNNSPILGVAISLTNQWV